MPKGVMFPQGEFVEALLSAAMRLGYLTSTPTERAGLRDVVDAYSTFGPQINIPCSPLMHGTGMWVGAMPMLISGGAVLLLESRSFDASEVWRLTEREGVTLIAIVGDPFVTPPARLGGT